MREEKKKYREENDVLNFYKNNCRLEDEFYFIDKDNSILSISDYEFQAHNMRILFLFPELLSSSQLNEYLTNATIRSNVIKLTLRILLFYGYVLDSKEFIKQVKPIYRKEKGKIIGLFSKSNYIQLTRIMNFLNIINMEFLSAIVFLMLCHAMKVDPEFYKKVTNKTLRQWINTQTFLKEWGQSCKILGLNYTGNSCYMDSTLLSIFAIPNNTITNNILNKNLTTLKTKKLWSKCNPNIDTDIKIRQDIQKALNNITQSIRGKNNIKTCSNLRSLIKKCPGSQPFHNTETQDAGEFLSYLFNLFQVNVATTKRETYGSNSLSNNPKWTLVTSSIDIHASPIIDITSIKLININENYNITKFVKQTDDSSLQPLDIWTPDKDKPTIFLL